MIFDGLGNAITEFPEVNGKRVMPVDIKQAVLPSGAATSDNQTDGSQKTQIVDSGGESPTVTNNKLDVNATPPLTAGFVGQSKIAVTGTAMQLSSQALTNGVILTAKSTNAGNLIIGGSGVTNVSDGTGNGYILEPGASVSLAITNLNVIYFNGTANDVLSWAAC